MDISNRIRMIFCKHEFKLEKNTHVIKDVLFWHKDFWQRTYMCKKCGCIRRF